MYHFISKLMEGSSPAASVMVSIAFMLFFGFLFTRVAKLLKLPNVTAYIIAGVVLGPYCLSVIPTRVIEGMDFLSDIALAFIAFSAAEFFRFDVLKKNGAKVFIITIFEALLASVFVFIALFYVLGLDFSFSIVLAALASATAPASTLMTIRQTGARGDFVDTLLQVVALDDVVGLMAYSIAISAALASMSGSFSLSSLAQPIIVNIAVLVLGCLFGFLLKLLLAKRSTDNRLIVLIAMLFTFCGICALLGVSPLLGCMSMGTVYINFAKDERLFKQLNYFSPPILLLFFVRSGLSFNLGALFSMSSSVGAVSLLAVGFTYFLVRIFGKYAGAFLGSAIVKKKAEVRNYLGLALVPQAGVAIGLAAIGARTLAGEAGEALETIILASSVLYELIGPASAKLALYLSHSYDEKKDAAEIVFEPAPSDNGLGLLIDRVMRIQDEIPHPCRTMTDEEAFTEAAEQYLAFAGRRRSGARYR